MIIGIMSDTHDQLGAIDAILGCFASAGVEHILHCGDFVAPFSVKRLAKAGCPVTAVYGNNDGERQGIAKAFGDWGEVHERAAKIELAGRRIAMVHEPDFVEEIAASGAFDVVIYGHLHKAELRRVGETLIINPGGGGVPDGPASCCVLDLSTMEAEISQV